MFVFVCVCVGGFFLVRLWSREAVDWKLELIITQTLAAEAGLAPCMVLPLSLHLFLSSTLSLFSLYLSLPHPFFSPSLSSLLLLTPCSLVQSVSSVLFSLRLCIPLSQTIFLSLFVLLHLAPPLTGSICLCLSLSFFSSSLLSVVFVGDDITNWLFLQCLSASFKKRQKLTEAEKGGLWTKRANNWRTWNKTIHTNT